MKKFLTTCAFVLAAPLTAQAASLGFESAPGALTALPGNFNENITFQGFNFTDNSNILATTGVATNTGIAINSLEILTQSNLKFTFLGASAGYTNKAFAVGGQELFNEDTANFGDMVSISNVGAGLLDFDYCTNSGSGPSDDCINNNKTVSGNSDGLNMAISKIFNTPGGDAAILFFGDDAGDSDRNDMIVAVQVQAVPLPAAGFLLLAGLGGLFGLRRFTS